MLVAVFIGLAVGLILTYGIYRARLAMSPTPNPAPTPSADALGTPLPATANGKLTLVSPEDESVQADKKVTVAGTTIPNAYTVILVNDAETITTSDGSGNFSKEVALQSGSNVISVHVLDPSGSELTLDRTVIVANLDALTASASASPSSSPSPKVSPVASPKSVTP